MVLFWVMAQCFWDGRRIIQEREFRLRYFFRMVATLDGIIQEKIPWHGGKIFP